MSNSQTRLIRITIGMLNSMINSGEQHVKESEKMVELANKAIDSIEDRLSPTKLVMENPRKTENQRHQRNQ